METNNLISKLTFPSSLKLLHHEDQYTGLKDTKS